jgi:hypothetical protein
LLAKRLKFSSTNSGLPGQLEKIADSPKSHASRALSKRFEIQSFAKSIENCRFYAALMNNLNETPNA